MTIRRSVVAVALGLVCAFTSAARADLLPLEHLYVEIGYQSGQDESGNPIYTTFELDAADSELYTVEPIQVGDTVLYHLQGEYYAHEFYELGWDMLVNPDPAVFGNFAFTNFMPVANNFFVSVMMPAVVPATPFTTRSGSISATINDTSGIAGLPGTLGDGVTIATTPGFPIYQSKIDGGVVDSLVNDPFSHTVAFGTGVVGPANFGPIIDGTSVGASIGIDHRFNLTAGDSATITSRFEINSAIPEPASMALLAIGGLAVIRRRR